MWRECINIFTVFRPISMVTVDFSPLFRPIWPQFMCRQVENLNESAELLLKQQCCIEIHLENTGGGIFTSCNCSLSLRAWARLRFSSVTSLALSAIWT